VTESKNVSAMKITIMKNNNNKQLKALTNSDVKQTGSRLLQVNESVIFIYKKEHKTMNCTNANVLWAAMLNEKALAFVTNAIKKLK